MHESTCHFLQFSDLSKKEIQNIFTRAKILKTDLKKGIEQQSMSGKILVMIFEKHSTRTRLSFEIGMKQLGGKTSVIQGRDTQIDRGESLEDAANVISRMCDGIMVRTFEHAKLQKFADNSVVPVINGLTNEHHPCQVLSDIYTFVERKGDISGKICSWIGDINNMCFSWIQAAKLLDFELRISCPPEYKKLLVDSDLESPNVTFFENPIVACREANIITTDVWTSMGFEAEQNQRNKTFQAWRVDADKIKVAREDVLFMHCLPAHRGDEVSSDVIDGPNSVGFEEAENRLHVQKALLEQILVNK
mgnify:FL=1